MPDPQIVTNPDLVAQVAQISAALTQLTALGSHVMTGGMTAHVLEWAKGRTAFAALWDKLNARWKAISAAAVAAVPAAGIVFTFSHPGDGHFVFDLNNLTLTTGGIFLWSFVQNWFVQQGYYQLVLKPKEVSGPALSQKPSTAQPVPVVVETAAPAAEGGGH